MFERWLSLFASAGEVTSPWPWHSLKESSLLHLWSTIQPNYQQVQWFQFARVRVRTDLKICTPLDVKPTQRGRKNTSSRQRLDFCSAKDLQGNTEVHKPGGEDFDYNFILAVQMSVKISILFFPARIIEAWLASFSILDLHKGAFLLKKNTSQRTLNRIDFLAVVFFLGRHNQNHECARGQQKAARRLSNNFTA